MLVLKTAKSSRSAGLRKRDTDAQRRWFSRGARFYRSAHPSRGPAILGSAWHLVLFSWGNVGGAWQLRFELGAGESGEPRRCDQELRARRGDQPEGARRRRA